MKRLGIGWVILFLLLGTFFLPWREAQTGERTGYVLPGNLKEGWKVFNQKRCNRCHAIWGEGGKGGPDLGAPPESYVSPVQLTVLLWNHWPEMWARMSAQKIPTGKIEGNEMADLFAFLYFIRYTDEPGNVEKGKALMQEKSCSQCHTVGEGAKDLSRWSKYTNPILWAQHMWNHAPQMEAGMKRKGIAWIRFAGDEMVDLIAYIRSLDPRAEKVYLSPGDPESGEKVFTEKGCAHCHGPRTPLDLSKKKDFARTTGQLAAMMWNHFPEMWKGMEEKGLVRPTLSSQEMADLVAYLFSLRYFDEPGDPEQGRTVFLKKQCDSCHGKGPRRLDLSPLKGKISPIFMAQTMWNHGPEMLEKMRKAKVPWRRIDRKEMADLMEYLNRGMPQ
jgi:mono/diheme cytochrome c family protein